MFSQLTWATNTVIIMPPWQQKKYIGKYAKIFPQLLKCFQVKYIWRDRRLLRKCTKSHRNHSNIIQILFYYSILFLNLLFSLTKRQCVLQEWPTLECFSVQAGTGTLWQNLHKHQENMQTPHPVALKPGLTPGPSFSGAEVLTSGTPILLK